MAGPIRILLTGGSGKAGDHVAPYLAAQGHLVVNADLTPLGHPDVTDLTVDLTDAGQTYSTLAGVPTQPGFDDPDLDLTHNNVIEPDEYTTLFPPFQADPALRRRNLFVYIHTRDLGPLVLRCRRPTGWATRCPTWPTPTW